MVPKEKSGHLWLGKMHCLDSNLASGACFYVHALNKKAHECLSKPGLSRFFGPHRIRTGNGAEPRQIILLSGRAGAFGKGWICAPGWKKGSDRFISLLFLGIKYMNQARALQWWCAPGEQWVWFYSTNEKINVLFSENNSSKLTLPRPRLTVIIRFY